MKERNLSRGVKLRAWALPNLLSGLFVDIFAVTNTEDKHNEFVVFYVTDYAIVANTVSPQPHTPTGQWLTKAMGVFIGGNAFTQIT